ncbi:MAG TPA: hypothetical protein V6D08_12065 [Candidatus Obscuribacterales bacterium]
MLSRPTGRRLALAALLCLIASATPAGAQYDYPAEKIPTFTPEAAPARVKPPDTQPGPPLTGLAEFTTVSAQALAVQANARLFPDCRATDFTCVKVSLKNNDTQIITIKGNEAQAAVGGQTTTAVPEETLIKCSGCQMSGSQTALLWGVGLATVGFAGPILQEMLTHPKYPQAAYGSDAGRQRAEGARLGNRIVLPGDETTGWLCFQIPAGRSPEEITLPVSSPTQSGRVAVHISAAGQAASPVK